MRVGIDITGLSWKYRTGVQNIYYGLIDGLTNLEANGIEYVLIDRSGQDASHLSLKECSHIKFRQPSTYRFLPTFGSVSPDGFFGKWNRLVKGFGRRIANQRVMLDRLLGDLDVYQVWNWDPRNAPRSRHVIMLTDVIPIVFADLFDKGFVEKTRLGLDFAKTKADWVVAISQFTKAELVRVAGLNADRISVVYPGIRSMFKPLEDRALIDSARQRYGIHDRPYILGVGFLDPRKNIKGHIRAFEMLAADDKFRDLQLVLVGPASFSTSQVLSDVESARVRDRIHVTGYVPDEYLVALMNDASVFVYCSLYEGFGFPVLEAMACGTPVVTSNSASLAEISRDAALLVNPEEYAEIAQAIGRVLTEDDLRDELRTRGWEHSRQFTWERCVKRYVEVYRQCLG